MISVLISWLLSALVLFLMQFIPFINISFAGGIFSMNFLIVAIVIGLINAFLVPLVKNILKSKSSLILFVVSLVIDAAALLLAAWLPIGFGINPVSALIAAAILSFLNLGASSVAGRRK